MTTLDALQAEIDAVNDRTTLVKIIKLACDKLEDTFGVENPLGYAESQLRKIESNKSFGKPR